MVVDAKAFFPPSHLTAIASHVRRIESSASEAALVFQTWEAVRSIGCNHFSYIAELDPAADAPFLGLFTTLPSDAVQYVQDSAAYRDHAAFHQLQATGVGLSFDLHPSCNTQADELARAVLGRLGIRAVALAPVISVSQARSFIVGYGPQHWASQSVIQALACIGSAMSLKLLCLRTPREDDYPDLTTVQAEIMNWVAAGKSNGDIATIMSMTRRTCTYHLSEVYRKLGVSSRAQATAALKSGAA